MAGGVEAQGPGRGLGSRSAAATECSQAKDRRALLTAVDPPQFDPGMRPHSESMKAMKTCWSQTVARRSVFGKSKVRLGRHCLMLAEPHRCQGAKGGF